MYNSWGYGGLGWNTGWYGGYSNWYGHQYWAYNNPFCSGFGFSYNDWYADAGSVHYGPRLGGKSYGGRTKSKSFVMQDDGFDNPRMRSQGLSMPAVSSAGGAVRMMATARYLKLSIQVELVKAFKMGIRQVQ